MRQEGRFSAVDLFLSFLIGGVAGAGIALLLATRSGHETRKRIKDFTEAEKPALKKRTSTTKKSSKKAVTKAKKTRA